MNKIAFIALGAAFVLTACQTGPARMFTEKEPRSEGYKAAFTATPNPTAPNVFVNANQLVLVDQEPIYPPPGEVVSIYFALPEGGTYEFVPGNGIRINENPGACSPGATRFVYKCVYSRPAAGTKYRYTIRVRPVAGGPVLQDLDPTVMN